MPFDQRSDAGNVIGVGMGDQNSVQIIHGKAQRRQGAADAHAADARIYEQTRAASDKKRCVA